MSAVTERQILDALGRVADPDKGADIVSLGMVSGLVIRDGNVAFAIEVERERGPRLEPLRKAAEKAVEALPGVLSVTAVLTAQAPPRGRAARRQPPRPRGPAGVRTARGAVPGVGAIVAVASGKGGVGKSTVAANLALGLQANGLRVGVLDADIYGPSMPRMLGISGRPRSRDGKILHPDGELRAQMHVDGVSRARGHADDLARPDGDERLAADAARGRVGRARHHDRRHAARHRRRAVDDGAAGAAGRRGHRLDAAGHRADRRPQGAQHVHARSTCRCSASSRT